MNDCSAIMNNGVETRVSPSWQL